MAIIEFAPYFAQYETLVKKADEAFRKVQEQYPQLVKCKNGCADCCEALFDLTLIEAIYISQKFRDLFQGKELTDLLEHANRIDRKIYKIKKSAFDDFNRGKNEVDILGQMALERVRCPLLNADNACRMYAYRPITCRIYGVPTTNNGMSHTCGLSGFEEGTPYPTINLDQIHQTLHRISSDFAASLKTKFNKMADLLVPLSMAILTEYDEKYLGLTD